MNEKLANESLKAETALSTQPAKVVSLSQVRSARIREVLIADLYKTRVPREEN